MVASRYPNRLHSRDLIVLGLFEVLWLSEDRYKILTIFRLWGYFRINDTIPINLELFISGSRVGATAMGAEWALLECPPKSLWGFFLASLDRYHGDAISSSMTLSAL